jgi:hypothetical protein
LNLTHNVAFTNEDYSHAKPLINNPGLYIYWKWSVLVVEAHDLKSVKASNAIKGVVRISDFTNINTQDQITASYHEGEKYTNVDFSATGDGKLLLLTILNSAQIELAQNVPLDSVYIGPAGVHANKRVFDIARGGDRHGMAWADFNGDGQTDTFIIRGGRRGTMIPDPLFQNDELMVQTKTGFEYRTRESGITTKGGCPGRQVSWVDYDRDGLLDIYVSCGRNEQPREKYDNQLHRQWKSGKFVDVAKHTGLNFPEVGTFLWFDKQNDGYMDLFWAGPNDFRLFLNINGHFEEESLGLHNGNISQLTVADYDKDGDFDIFIASSKGNILLENSQAGFERKDLKPLGLPTASISGNWVDYDNDGLMDLHVLPQGVYRQVSDNNFVATDILKSKSNIKARCSWGSC